MSVHVAVDLGAESGRVIRGVLVDGRLEIEEVARFKTGVAKIDGHRRWNLPRFLEEIITGLRVAGERGPVDSIGVDSFGVDFGLLDENDELKNLGLPPADPSVPRSNGQFPRWVDRLPGDERAKMESRGETVVNATRKETTFRLEETNLRGYRGAGGSLEGTRYARLLDEMDG